MQRIRRVCTRHNWEVGFERECTEVSQYVGPVERLKGNSGILEFLQDRRENKTTVELLDHTSVCPLTVIDVAARRYLEEIQNALVRTGV
jgi:hypothetical protein